MFLFKADIDRACMWK